MHSRERNAMYKLGVTRHVRSKNEPAKMNDTTSMVFDALPVLHRKVVYLSLPVDLSNVKVNCIKIYSGLVFPE